ncbi:MAG: hypothetical protein FWG29_03050 [Treponema sp.]|nr:hypothetical protein [Treponema sp.]
MTNTAQVDKILLEVNDLEEKEKILFFHKVEELFNNFDDEQNNDIPIEAAFGLWKDRNITKETLREKAWNIYT